MSWRDRLPQTTGRIALNADLGPYTWLRVGGPAEVLYLPHDEADLQNFLRELDTAVPVTTLGVGSNTLVRDGGVEGVVIKLSGDLAKIEVDGNELLCGGGARRSRQQ